MRPESPGVDGGSKARKLEALVLASPILAPVLRDWPAIALPDCWLVAGALAQTAWNDAFRVAPRHGISDIDLVYFDATDLSESAEAHHSDRIQRLSYELPVRIGVKNEARVHLWYGGKFGYEIRPYVSTEDAIGSSPATATALGVRPDAAGLSNCAPFGLRDLFNLVVRPNKRQIARAIYETKVRRWEDLWPRLTIMEW
ncbi:MAG: nucleotidyltransferase family protein [Rhizobiales bacterium]|nr:nucleotidyltransferase family protein [Hyphomicrobiales bacterium]